MEIHRTGNKEGATVKDDGWKYRGLSYFTRLNYNYNDKYMLMFTFRADGSSKYNDKWGYFPSIGAAWVIVPRTVYEEPEYPSTT